jgi:transcriptional regulator with XRE-family HTH domain
MRRRTIDRDIDRILARLRDVIREQGYTQLEVQEALGWGRSYISQLVTRQKTLRMDQLHEILHVIGVKPEDFWGEVYGFGGPYKAQRHPPPKPRRPGDPPEIDPDELASLKKLLLGLVALLKKKSVIKAADLERAVAAARRE